MHISLITLCLSVRSAILSKTLPNEVILPRTPDTVEETVNKLSNSVIPVQDLDANSLALKQLHWRFTMQYARPTSVNTIIASTAFIFMEQRPSL